MTPIECLGAGLALGVFGFFVSFAVFGRPWRLWRETTLDRE